VDHRNGTLHFGAQQVESDKIRGHISLLAKRLSKALTMIEPGAVPPAVASVKASALALCRDNVAKEHSRLLARKQVGGLLHCVAWGEQQSVSQALVRGGLLWTTAGCWRASRWW
jgi:hypothetical protein